MLASGAGAAARTAIGVVIVFGVSIATIITLFMIPCFIRGSRASPGRRWR